MKFHVQLEAGDLWRFSMYNIYRSVQGIFNIMVTIVALYLLIFKQDIFSYGYVGVLVMLALLLTVTQPFMVFARAKQQARDPVIKEAIDLEFGDQLIIGQAGQETAVPWNRVFKVVKTRSMLIIYLDKMRAYLLPLHVVAGDMEELSEIIRGHVPKNQLKGL